MPCVQVQDSMVMFPRLLQSQRSFTFSNYADLRRQELTCISEVYTYLSYLQQ